MSKRAYFAEWMGGLGLAIRPTEDAYHHIPICVNTSDKQSVVPNE